MQPQQLLALTARRSTADAVRTLSLCAMHDDKQGRACRAALTVWLSEEQRLSEAERAAPAFASRFRFGSSAPVLGLATSCAISSDTASARAKRVCGKQANTRET